MLTTRTARKIQELPLEDWNAVFPDTPESYHLYKSIDESGFEGFSFFYILVYEGAKPVGAAPCFLVNYAADSTIGCSGSAMKFLKRISLGNIRIKMLMCGLALGEGRIGIAGSGRRDVLSAITAEMERIAGQFKASIIVFKDFPEAYEPVLGSLVDCGFSKFHGFPAAELDVRHDSIDGYLSSLRPGPRKDLKAKFSKIKRLPKVELKISGSLDGYLDRAYELYLQTYEKSSTRFELVPKRFFANISVNLPGQTKYFMWFLDDKLVAFNLCLVSDGLLIGEYVGFDYAFAYKYHLYFLRFRDILNWCMENGIKKYSLGATGYQIKSRLGATFKPAYTYVKHRNKFLNPAVKMACRFLDPTNFDKSMKQAAKGDPR